jgi:N6-adenosine-specific RNA methylase IME4
MTDPTNRPPLYAWKDWPEDCPECGGPLQVFTDDSREGWATHGDTVRCVDPECGARGHINADAEDNCYAMLPDLDP